MKGQHNLTTEVLTITIQDLNRRFGVSGSYNQFFGGTQTTQAAEQNPPTPVSTESPAVGEDQNVAAHVSSQRPPAPEDQTAVAQVVPPLVPAFTPRWIPSYEEALRLLQHPGNLDVHGAVGNFNMTGDEAPYPTRLEIDGEPEDGQETDEEPEYELFDDYDDFERLGPIDE
jgi:hypothetical protein